MTSNWAFEKAQKLAEEITSVYGRHDPNYSTWSPEEHVQTMIAQALRQAAADATLRERERCEAILNDELYDAERAEWRTPADRLTVRAWLLNARARIRQDAGAQSPEPELSSLHKIVEAPVVEPPNPEYARGVHLAKIEAYEKVLHFLETDFTHGPEHFICRWLNECIESHLALLPKAPGRSDG